MLLGTTLVSHGQQAPQFTQFMFNNLALNPAYAGADEALSVTVLGRSQWTGVEGAPSTQSLAAHSLFFQRVGLGLSIVNDRIGIHRHTNAMISGAYQMKTGRRSFLSFGLETGITSLRSDYASLGISNDPKASGVVRIARLNLGAGVYFRSRRLDLGFSVPGMLSKKVEVNDTVNVFLKSPDFLTYARYRLRLNDRYTLQPALLLKYFPSLPLSCDMNVSIIYRNVLTAGLSYRTSESIDALLKLQITPRMELGYAYDHPLKNAAYLSTASHEVMLHYVFRKSNRGIVTPR